MELCLEEVGCSYVPEWLMEDDDIMMQENLSISNIGGGYSTIGLSRINEYII
jgi:hypothetical protein